MDMDANDANNGNTDDAMDVDVEPLNAAQPSKNEVASTSAQHPAPQQEELPNFWIEMPPKPANWKEYHRLTIPNPPISLDLSNYQDPDDDGAELLCLVGEHDFRTEGVWYYAEMDDESFRKFPLEWVKKNHSELYETYAKEKREGTLDRFDPENERVRPSDKPSAAGRKRRVTLRMPSKRTSNSDDSAEFEFDSGDADAFSEDDRSGWRVTRQVSRNQKRDNQGRSPRRTRQQHRRTAKDGKKSSASAEVESDEGSMHSLKLKIRVPKAIRPTYGFIHSVHDTYAHDAGKAALYAHRKLCEKCGKAPTLSLLAAFRKRGRRRKKLDEFEVVTDEESLGSLGGWVSCMKCCVSYHWACLPLPLKDDVLRAAKLKDPSPVKRRALDPTEATDVTCLMCNKGGICMTCEVDAYKGRNDDDLFIAAPATPAASDKEKSTAAPPTTATATDDAVPPADNAARNTTAPPEDEKMDSPEPSSPKIQFKRAPISELLFRCKTCKRIAHYEHLPPPHGRGESENPYSAVELAEHYQKSGWQCRNCHSWQGKVDKILAWRPYPPHAKEPKRKSGEAPSPKTPLPREYLVKWKDWGYNRVEWVPHRWLAATTYGQLRNFLIHGSLVQLLPPDHEDVLAARAYINDIPRPAPKVIEPRPSLDADGKPTKARDRIRNSAEEEVDPDAPTGRVDQQPDPVVDAEVLIPKAWQTVDRVLEVWLWKPIFLQEADKREKGKAAKKATKAKLKAQPKPGSKIISDEEDDDELEMDELDSDLDEDERNHLIDERINREARLKHGLGKKPANGVWESIQEREARTGNLVGHQDIEDVIWCYIKWQDLEFEQATWDAPPSDYDPGSKQYERAFLAHLAMRDIKVIRLTKAEAEQRDNRSSRGFKPCETQPSFIPDTGKLMPFQLDGFNWLWKKWWDLHPCILADEMGLGKTIQIVTFLGKLVLEQRVFPSLVVVPTSTVTNWIREFEKWAPGVRVVQYNGEAASREIIRKYELYHLDGRSLKYHILVTTYDTVTGKDFASVFKSVPRWEVLVVDEGQRLKGDNSLLLNRLRELNTIHRILMTGTPLNNNIRELFNLLNFLDPTKWVDSKALEAHYAELNEQLVADLHELLKPYFLRRIKTDVMADLPPKHEVIVPVSMTTYQREVYKSILAQNAKLLGSLAQTLSASSNRVPHTSMHNVLMQLRKCMQHPYLIDRNFEPTGLSELEAHKRLIETSTKLVLLKTLLAKLKEKGHRVLLFSQFVIALDIIEDFVVGEGYKFLRLDGNSKQAERQRDMDKFNKPGSDYFLYLLSTRAGGVGVNLWSADTVIVFDPDFNPHQDLQAIARAHRMGQTKTVLVFRLMTKGAAEEKIIQTGKKKLALDHLIVQTMDNHAAEDSIQSTLTFGAKAIFEQGEDDSSNITYSENDVEKLIEKLETQDSEPAQPTGAAMSFSFAKIWERDRNTLEEVPEEAMADDAQDFWEGVLARSRLEQQAREAKQQTGRGVRRNATKSAYIVDTLGADPLSPTRKNRKGKKASNASSDGGDSDYVAGADRGGSASSIMGSADEDAMDIEEILAQLSDSTSQPRSPPKPGYKPYEDNPIFENDPFCGICGTNHLPSRCLALCDVENLRELRDYFKDGPEPEAIRRVASQVLTNRLRNTQQSLKKAEKKRTTEVSSGDDRHPPNESERPKKAKLQTTDAPPRPQAQPKAIRTPSLPPVSLAAAPPPHAPQSRKSSSGGSGSSNPTKHIRGPKICPVCMGPHHLLKDCPCTSTPSGIAAAIVRLQRNEGSHQSLLLALQNLLKPAAQRVPISELTR